MVAKSLALARSIGGIGGLAMESNEDNKKDYDWLFNEEEEQESSRRTQRQIGNIRKAEEEIETERSVLDSA
jgi:hypothetical protein